VQAGLFPDLRLGHAAPGKQSPVSSWVSRSGRRSDLGSIHRAQRSQSAWISSVGKTGVRAQWRSSQAPKFGGNDSKIHKIL